MSTVDQQSAESIIEGRYKKDGFDSIIIYGTMFGTIAFKLCRGQYNLNVNVQTFKGNRWPHVIGWTATKNGYGPDALEKFHEELDHFCKQHSATHQLREF